MEKRREAWGEKGLSSPDRPRSHARLLPLCLPPKPRAWRRLIRTRIKICCSPTDLSNRAHFHPHDLNKAKQKWTDKSECRIWVVRMSQLRQILASKLSLNSLGIFPGIFDRVYGAAGSLHSDQSHLGVHDQEVATWWQISERFVKVGTHEGTRPCDWSLQQVPGTSPFV